MDYRKALTLDRHVAHDGSMSEQPDTAPGTIPAWTLGWRLQRSLAHARMSVSQMTWELEVSRGTVSRWMADKGSDPREMYLRKWALRTGVPFTWLCHGDMQPCDYGPRGIPAGQGTSRGYSTKMQQLRTHGAA